MNKVSQTLLEPLYKQYFARPIAFARFQGIYPTFSDAERAVPATLPGHFDTDDAAGMYGDRLDRLHPEDYAPLFWLSRVVQPGMSLFDLGGHIGIARHAFGRVLPVLAETRWICQDLPAVATRGAALLAERPAPGLSFTSEVSDGDGAHVWLGFGSPQYLNWDLPDRLVALKTPPRWVILNKIPVHPWAETVTLQNVGTAICPYRIFADAPLVSAYRAAGYRLVDRWKNPGCRCHIPFHTEFDVDPYSGFAFERSEVIA